MIPIGEGRGQFRGARRGSLRDVVPSVHNPGSLPTVSRSFHIDEYRRSIAGNAVRMRASRATGTRSPGIHRFYYLYELVLMEEKK
jgi:hypothetical protein